MQQSGFEWLYRLLRNPRRLAKRYLIRGPLIFLLLWRIEFRLRQSKTVAVETKEMPTVPASAV
jgi:hypothetical protein